MFDLSLDHKRTHRRWFVPPQKPFQIWHEMRRKFKMRSLFRGAPPRIKKEAARLWVSWLLLFLRAVLFVLDQAIGYFKK
jgi:hypothetical protein